MYIYKLNNLIKIIHISIPGRHTIFNEKFVFVVKAMDNFPAHFIVEIVEFCGMFLATVIFSRWSKLR